MPLLVLEGSSRYRSSYDDIAECLLGSPYSMEVAVGAAIRGVLLLLLLQ